MISQLFVLSPRGDSIIFRDYRGDVGKGAAEVFFRKVKFWGAGAGGGEAPPVFAVDGVSYLHLRSGGLLFAATTRGSPPPALVLELLQRCARVAKDYLGVLSEESVRRNFVLVYELLDEMIDFGFPQSTSTEALKAFVFNDPVVVDAARVPSLGAAGLFLQGIKRLPSTAVTKSVVATDGDGRKREEIFVDLVERISVTFNASGYILTSEIDGSLQMKSYLTGNPEIRVALNEDLAIGRDSSTASSFGPDYGAGSGGAGMVLLDDCNFHESVRLDDFDLDRTLALVSWSALWPLWALSIGRLSLSPGGRQQVPPDGEFSVMNYRMTQEFKPPFRVYPVIEEAGPFKALAFSSSVLSLLPVSVELMLKVRADFPTVASANSVVLRVPLPKCLGVAGTQSRSLLLTNARVSFEMEAASVGQSTDYKEATKSMEWMLKKIVGASEHVLRVKLTLNQERSGQTPNPTVNLKKEVGPVSMTFTIPMYNASRLQVRYLQIMKKSKSYNPYRWVRYVTHANSYVIRI
eukprot:SM000084S23106  [mRNA]  locus=s84:133800:135919:- [translate_table: standard]